MLGELRKHSDDLASIIGKGSDNIPKRTKLQALVDWAEAVGQRTGLPVAKSMVHAKAILNGVTKVAKVAGPVMAVISWQQNVEAYDLVEGTARSVPVLGDLITIAIDGTKITLALAEIGRLSNQGERGAKLTGSPNNKQFRKNGNGLSKTILTGASSPTAPKSELSATRSSEL